VCAQCAGMAATAAARSASSARSSPFALAHRREVAQAHERGHATRGAGRLRADAGGRDVLVVDGRRRADVAVAEAEQRRAAELRGGLLVPDVDAPERAALDLVLDSVEPVVGVRAPVQARVHRERDGLGEECERARDEALPDREDCADEHGLDSWPPDDAGELPDDGPAGECCPPLVSCTASRELACGLTGGRHACASTRRFDSGGPLVSP
jgi:hypothetical protein